MLIKTSAMNTNARALRCKYIKMGKITDWSKLYNKLKCCTNLSGGQTRTFLESCLLSLDQAHKMPEVQLDPVIPSHLFQQEARNLHRKARIGCNYIYNKTHCDSAL